MGKLIFYVSALIFIDLLFIITAQVGLNLTSIVIEGILDLSSFGFSTFFTNMVGNVKDLFSSTTGFSSLILGAGVTASILFSRSDVRLFVPLAITFGVLAADFVTIYIYLASISLILATLLMGPMTMVYVVVVVDWLKGRD